MAISRSKFDRVIKALKNNRAEVYDGISNEMIANSPTIVLDLLFNFINLCLGNSLIPLKGEVTSKMQVLIEVPT